MGTKAAASSFPDLDKQYFGALNISDGALRNIVVIARKHEFEEKVNKLGLVLSCCHGLLMTLNIEQK